MKPRSKFLFVALMILISTGSGCSLLRGQRYIHFTTKTPLEKNHTLVLGFLGGWEAWDAEERSVRKLALDLRSRNLSGIQIETVENRKRELAIELIRNSFDRNRDGRLDAQECSSARLILYGHSFGGAAVVKLARQLKRMNVPVLLTIQIDSVGRDDHIIPSNVAKAANLFQRNGLLIQGENRIRAEDSNTTKIIGNFKYDYRQRKVDLSGVCWSKRWFQIAHTKMECDGEVWAIVEEFIMSEINRSTP